MNNNLQKL